MQNNLQGGRDSAEVLGYPVEFMNEARILSRSATTA